MTMLEAATDKIKAYKAYFYDRGPSFLSQDVTSRRSLGGQNDENALVQTSQSDYKMTHVLQSVRENYMSSKSTDDKKIMSPI